jgi:hypothetical protein
LRIRQYAIGLAAALMSAGAAAAPPAPADLTAIPAVRSDHVPARTSWGDPDLRGTWPLQRFVEANIPLQRPEAAGRRAWQTDEEHAARIASAEQFDARADSEDGVTGSVPGLADWVRTHRDGRRTSLIVEPDDGRLPPLTPSADALFKAGKSSWVNTVDIDWITDLDAFDRCITRGVPSIMSPVMQNNAVRIFQAPGLVVLKMETLETRLIRIGAAGHPPSAVRSWMGDSRGHWEGSTLVIETANIVAGNSTGEDPVRLAASPAYQAGPVPVGEDARLVERLTMLGPGEMAYEATYSDPGVFTAPWSIRLTWVRDDGYRMFEYACHEGNTQIRHMINSSRAQRRLDAAATTAGVAAP